MRLTPFLAALASAASTGYFSDVRNRNHLCHGPRDCEQKCENGTYYTKMRDRLQNSELRCNGTNSDYSYWSVICRNEMAEGIILNLNKKICLELGGMHCDPRNNETIPMKKSTQYRCILEPSRYGDFGKLCNNYTQTAVTAVLLKDHPWDCNPDYLE